MAPSRDQQAFVESWPGCFIIFLAFIEVICVIILILTELGNVAANFWTTNVFAGGWCGLIMLINLILLFMAGCSPAPARAFRAVIFACIGLIASAALISFDAIFIAQPTTCIMTSSCTANSASNTTFTYSFRQSFFNVFNSWSPFQSYTESQAKLLFQTIQIGIGGLCFIICIMYVIIYYYCTSKVEQKVAPTSPLQQQEEEEEEEEIPQDYYPPQQGYYPSVQPGYYSPPSLVQPDYNLPSQPPLAAQGYYPPPAPQQKQQYYQQPGPAWRPQPYVPQAQPGAIPWNANRRY